MGPPGFEPGDQYRIAFLTEDDYSATSTNIADYNNAVQAEGDGHTRTSGPTYFVIGSTADVDAIDNIGGASSIPIYLVNGVIIADSTDDLFDGSLRRYRPAYTSPI